MAEELNYFLKMHLKNLELKKLKNSMSCFQKNIVIYILDLPRMAKRLIVIALDCYACLFSVWFSFYLRLGEMPSLSNNLMIVIATSLGLAMPIFILSGLYRSIFRFSGMLTMITMTRAILIYGLLFSAIFTLFGVEGIPRTIGLIQPIVVLLLIGATRAYARIYIGAINQVKAKKSLLPIVLIYGAGSAGRLFASAMVNSKEMSIAGFLDDDEKLHGNMLNGLFIFNPTNLDMLIKKRGINHVLLAIPSASRSRRSQIIDFLSIKKLVVRSLPSLSDIATGKVGHNYSRELEIDDLLCREQINANLVLLNRNTQNQTVLVTGAGGSIGSELCRQLVENMPRQLLLIENSEYALYKINQEIQSIIKNHRFSTPQRPEVIPLIASVCDEFRMNEIFQTWRPHIIYHAAAYKHVPIVEHNPAEGVRNNVWGAKVCAEAAIRNGVRNFVLISTDKAVRPTNIMGASKRLAEMIIQALYETECATKFSTYKINNIATCFSMVRFGNVLDSSGSVVPLFRSQIKNGGPITLTHPEVTRYFMTIQEAAQLVIQSGSMGIGGGVLVLDMGKPVRIFDLARRMVELSGLSLKTDENINGDIEIKVTGLRPGEKLFEELLIGDNPKSTLHPRILTAQEKFIPWNKLQDELELMDKALRVNNIPLIISILQKLVTGYQPNKEVVDWVHAEIRRQEADSLLF